MEKFFFILVLIRTRIAHFLESRHFSIANSYGKVCSSNIFLFFHEHPASRNLPLSQMYRDVFGKGSRTIFHSERSAKTITGELPARRRGLASETGAKYGKTGDFRVAERATSRAQLFLGMEIIGTNET